MPINNTNNTTAADIAAANQCLDAFMREVNQELTVSCMLPHALPKKELNRIIGQAKKWFYKNYEYSMEEMYLFLPSSNWSTDAFKANSDLILDDSIFSVTSVWQIGRDSGEASIGSLFNKDTDFTIGKYIYNSQNYSSVGLASDSLMNYVLHEKFFDVSRQMLRSKMSYNFNHLTHKFRFMGELPEDNVILQVYTKIDDCSLFDDEIFFRYVVAQAKMQLSRVLGTFNYNLPGNITINFDLIREEGRDELDKIKEEIKGDEGVDWFYTG